MRREGKMQTFPIRAVTCATLLFLPLAAAAEADGPDAWRVSGVAQDDVLNVRMGPGVEYPVIGAFGPGARHLRAETCTPLASFAEFDALSASERATLPNRWCLIDGGSQGRGWVAQAYLVEDYLPAATSEQTGTDGGERASATFDIAVPLVRNFFEKEAFMLARGETLLVDRETSRAWLFLGLARKVARDPAEYSLFDAQDTDIGEITAMLDPDRPIRQGLVTVLVRFTNFGTPREARVLVRADPEQGGAFRIFAIEHQDGASIP